MVAKGAGRVLVAKPGLDGHDKGAIVVSMALREAGFEVIYLGRHQTTEHVARVAVEEDVDVVGLSVLSGTHVAYSQELLDALKEQGMEDDPAKIRVVVGGTVPPGDVEELLRLGVRSVFPSGSSLKDVVHGIEQIVGERRAALAETEGDRVG